MARSATCSLPSRLFEGPLLPGTRGRRIAATLSASEARDLVPLLLYPLLDPPRRARIKSPQVRLLLKDATVKLSDAEMLLLGCNVREGIVRFTDQDVSLSYLEREGADIGLRQRLRWSV